MMDILSTNKYISTIIRDLSESIRGKTKIPMVLDISLNWRFILGHPFNKLKYDIFESIWYNAPELNGKHFKHGNT